MNKPNSAWVLVVLSLYAFSMNAQDKNDFTWILGYNSNFPELFFGGNYIHFQPETPPSTTSIFRSIWIIPLSCRILPGGFNTTRAVAMSSTGEHRIMENGDDLSPGFYHDIYCDQADWAIFLIAAF